ncbi:MAG: BrnA antitoxin family protein [Holophaga sp.]|nr:BrnA antitoxin family protein [Holophaga sp.]
MSKRKPNPELIDDESPELTAEDFARMRPMREVFPELIEAQQRGELRVRGPQKAPTKERVALRLSPEVVEYFRGTGAGWQTRMDQALLEAVHRYKAG